MEKVLKNHIYGKDPHDIYIVGQWNEEKGWGDFAILRKETGVPPTLAELSATLGSSFIPQTDIASVIAQLEAEAAITCTDDDKVAFAREMVGRAINAYDTSDAVNMFTLGGDGSTPVPYWLNRETRSTLSHSVGVWKTAGKDTYRLDLREYGTSIDIPCDTLLTMLSRLEAYAVECYHTTSAHLNAIAVMTTVTDLTAYDYTAGYPDKLTFNI